MLPVIPEARICRFCKSPYTSHRPKYCSPICGARARGERAKDARVVDLVEIEEVSCACGCGEKFKIRSSGKPRKFFSEQCAHREEYRKKKADVSRRAEFMEKRRIISREYRKKLKDGRVKDCFCVRCGTGFRSADARKFYCGMICSSAARMDRAAEKRAQEAKKKGECKRCGGRIEESIGEFKRRFCDACRRW